MPSFPSPGRYARILLHIEAPMIVLAGIVFLISYMIDREMRPVWASVHYPSMVVYLLYPIMITAFSVLLVERLEKAE